MRKPPPRPPGSPAADDAALFREAVGPVRRLPPVAEPPAPPRPRPSTRMARRDDEAVLQALAGSGGTGLEVGDALSYRREDIPPRTLRRLANGEFAARDELDLHGLPAERAEALLRAFLRECLRDGVACVRIVHGKGRNSTDRLPILKNMVDRVLRQRADVLAFHSAPPAQGGTGAVLVLLATSRR